MAPTDGARFRALTAGDVAGAEALCAEAGWNQTGDDWRLMLRHGAGIGVEAEDGALVATAMTVPYGGRFGWIAMVLVTARWRRRGLASALLRRCIGDAERQGLIAGLDATEAGREVYRPLGFREVYAITRWRAERPSAAPSPVEGTVRAMREADLPRIAAYDAAIFGADRGWLLSHLLARRPARAVVAETAQGIRGFALARDGRTADHLGPLAADDAATAQALAERALAAGDGPALIDAPDARAGFAGWLAAAGFRPQRGFSRMLLGHSEPLDDPARVYAVAGPELG